MSATESSLAGKRILVTRSAHQAGALSGELVALGAEVVELPVIAIAPPDSWETLDRAISSLKEYEWIVLTSANAMTALTARLAEICPHQTPVSLLSHLKVACIGPATCRSVKKFGLQVDAVPADSVGESLAAELSSRISHSSVLIVRASVARDVVPEALRAAGNRVDIADAYQTILPPEAEAQFRALLPLRFDAVTFTSTSTVKNLAQLAAKCALKWPFLHVKALSIGPVTSQTLRETGWEPAAEASPSDVSGLVDAAFKCLQ